MRGIAYATREQFDTLPVEDFLTPEERRANAEEMSKYPWEGME